jgi:hypothetical protein
MPKGPAEILSLAHEASPVIAKAADHLTDCASLFQTLHPRAPLSVHEFENDPQVRYRAHDANSRLNGWFR